MRLFYKPFGIIAGLIGARLGRRLFQKLWAQIDTGVPPSAKGGQGSTTKVVTAAALEAATLAGTRAAVDRAGARSFHYLIGIWPEKPPKAKDEDAHAAPQA